MKQILEKLLKHFNNMKFEDVTQMALAGEFLGRLLDEYLDLLIQKNNLNKPTEEEIKKLREKIIADMQQKYPTAGIIDKVKK